MAFQFCKDFLCFGFLGLPVGQNNVINIEKDKNFIIISQTARFVGNGPKLYIDKDLDKILLPHNCW